MEKTMIRNIAVVSLSRGMIGEPDVQFDGIVAPREQLRISISFP